MGVLVGIYRQNPVGDFALLKSLRFIAAAACHLLVWCCVAAAQHGGPAAAPPSAKPLPAAHESPQPHVDELQPSIYYLPDKQGNLQPVLDFKYEDFVDLYKLKNQLGGRDQPPRYSLQRMSATGTATEQYAELTVQFQIVTRDDDWVRVPLRLDQGLLRGGVRYKGSAKQLVQYEGGDAGYVCWLCGKPDAQHEIALRMLVPLDSAGDETRLKLAAPRATASEMKLSVPADAVGTVSEGATLLSSVAKSGATEFGIAGLGGDFQLAWRKSNPTAETPVALESMATVLARLDGRRISTEATLSVRSLGAAFDRLTIQLPPDAEFSPGKPNGYTVTLLNGTLLKRTVPFSSNDNRRHKGTVPFSSNENRDSPPGNDNRDSSPGTRSVEVRLPKKTIGPVEIHLSCRRPYDPMKNPGWCELAGFEVVGAGRQSGTLAVAAGDNWQVLWGPSRETRQVDPLPEALRKDDVIAGFEYSSEPYSLSVKLAPRRTRISGAP